MDDDGQPTDLVEILDWLSDCTEQDSSVSVEKMMDIVGHRSFGPIILVIGLLALSPLSGIPSVPSIMGVIVILVAGQLLVGRKHFWLPKKILNRSVARDKLAKALKAIRPVARFIDRITRPRLTRLTGGAGARVTAGFCVLVAATMPPLELLPFMATTAGAALAAFGLALVAHDGVVAIIAILITGGVIGFGIYNLI